MKSKLLLGVLAAFSLAGAAQAQTVIEITGATAFRSAAVASINAAFTAGGGAGSFATAFSNTSSASLATVFNNGSCQIWKGTFPGITGTTVIRTSWNGSVEGVRAVSVPGIDPVTAELNDPLFLKESLLGANGTSLGFRLHSDPGGSGAATNALNYERAVADMSFSDVAKSATPVTGLTVAGGPVGVVVFTMIANKTWAEDKKVGDALSQRMPTSISAQQFRTLAKNGFVPLSFFTGNVADTTRVFLTGRNDGSGTRTSYLSETGVGASTGIQQYVGYDRTSATNLPSLYLVPANGGFDSAGTARTDYRSTVWGNNLDGNGGHVASGDVRDDHSKTTSSTIVYEFIDGDESGDVSADERQTKFAAAKLYLISWFNYNDARSARGTGAFASRNAEVLGYNGIRLDGLVGETVNPPSILGGNPVVNTDLEKVTNGSYTAWNFQQLYYLSTVTGASTVFTDLKTRLNDPTTGTATIGSAGVRIGLMNVNRTDDGGTILPGAPAP